MSDFRFARKMASLALLATVLVGHAQASQAMQPAATGAVVSPDQRIAEKFLRDFDAAIANKDLDAYSNLLTDDVANHVRASQQGGPPQDLTATKPQMVQAFTQLKTLMSDYRIERRDIQVTRQDNGDLLVKDSSTEHMTLGNVRVTTESQETMTLEVDGDMARAKAFDTTSSVTMAPVQAK